MPFRETGAPAPGRLHVMHVSVPTTEGVAAVELSYVRDQLERGWDVTVVCPSTGWLGYHAREAGARVAWWSARREPGPDLVAEALRLSRIVTRARPDVIHLHSAKAGLVGRLVVRGRIPTIYQPHAWSFLAATGTLRAGAVVTVEPGVYLPERGGVRADRDAHERPQCLRHLRVDLGPDLLVGQHREDEEGADDRHADGRAHPAVTQGLGVDRRQHQTTAGTVASSR